MLNQKCVRCPTPSEGQYLLPLCGPCRLRKNVKQTESRRKSRNGRTCVECGVAVGKKQHRCPRCVKQRKLKNMREWMVQYHIKTRKQVIQGYGGVCACCGESQQIFLSLDHVNSDGNKDRGKRQSGSFKTYRRAIREGFPPDLQLLCYNCNLGRAYNGGQCPHVNGIPKI